MPSCTSSNERRDEQEEPIADSGRVVIGMDPHKRTVTVEVMAADETVRGGGRFSTDVAGFEALRAYAGQWPDRVGAVEGCAGIGKHVVLRLLDAGDVSDVGRIYEVWTDSAGA